MTDAHRRTLLGEFIRSHRERLTPAAKSIGRRRTPGLRREELAQACAVSATWITWLEQGRDVAASVNALDRLAQALQLSAAERATLFDLAEKRDPIAPDEPSAALLPSTLALPSLLAAPAYLLDHTWTARAWNDAAAQLFVGWLDSAASERNLLKFVFLHPAAQTLIDDWPDRAARLVAQFRADFSRHHNDRAMQELIEQLSAQSPYFGQCWKAQNVVARDSGARHFQHPILGVLHFMQTTLIVASESDCKLVCLAPLGTVNHSD